MISNYRREWAEVTQADPLRIQLEHDSTPMEGTPDTLVANLKVGDKVRVVIFEGQAEVVGTPNSLRITATHVGIDTDGVPYFSEELAFSDAVPVIADTDGVPYVEVG